MIPTSVGEAQDLGYLARADDLVEVRRVVSDDGADRGSRSVLVRCGDGLDLDIKLDRGMDIGAVRFRGLPISWASTVRSAAPGRSDAGLGWLDGWTGGLLTTCGLRNIGAPSSGHGQHGGFTDISAHSIHVRRGEERTRTVEISGILDDASSLGSHLEVRRTIAIAPQDGEIVVTDRVRNLGHEPENAPLLYHVNVGYPFLGPRSRYLLDTSRSWRGDGGESYPADWAVMGPVERGRPDRIVSHQPIHPGAAAITSPHNGLRMSVSWDPAVMPHLHTWRRNEPGSYVASIEPATATLAGLAADVAAGVLSIIEPDAVRTSWLRIGIGSTDA